MSVPACLGVYHNAQRVDVYACLLACRQVALPESLAHDTTATIGTTATTATTIMIQLPALKLKSRLLGTANVKLSRPLVAFESAPKKRGQASTKAIYSVMDFVGMDACIQNRQAAAASGGDSLSSAGVKPPKNHAAKHLLK